MQKNFLKKGGYILLTLFILDLALVTTYYKYTTNWIANHSTCQNTYQTGIVYFHSLVEKEDILTPGSISRLTTALTLYQQKKITGFLVTGGNRKKLGYIEKKKPSGAKVMADWLIKNGVPKNRITIDSCSYDTVTNLENSIALTQQYSLGPLTSISAPLHLYRIQYLLQKTETSSGFCPVPATEISYPEIYLDVHQEWVAFFLMNWYSKQDYLKFIRSMRKVGNFDCN